VCAAGLLFWLVEVIMVGFFTVREFHKLWPTALWGVPAQQNDYLPQIPQFKRNSTRKVLFICPPLVEFGTALAVTGLGWCQQREKIDWQELPKFDCWLERTIFNFCCPSSIFTSY